MNKENELKQLNKIPMTKSNRDEITKQRRNHQFAIKIMLKHLGFK